MSPVRLFIHRFRRPLAAASAAIAVLLVATALRPSGPPASQIVVASTDLPAGSTLTPEDLTLQEIPSDYVAPGAVGTLDSAVGRTIASAITAGETVTVSRLVTIEGRADGLLTVPVRLVDPEVADLLQPGSRIDLVQSFGDSPGRVVAEDVQVVTVPRRAVPSTLGSASRDAGSLIVVATDRRTAVALAAVGTQPGLGVVLR